MSIKKIKRALMNEEAYTREQATYDNQEMNESLKESIKKALNGAEFKEAPDIDALLDTIEE